MIENDEFLEYARYVDNYYGTPRFYVEEMLAKGKNVILEIEIQGAMQIKAKIRRLFWYLLHHRVSKNSVIALQDAVQKLRVIESRLRRASEEAEGMLSYDYILVNDQVEDCVDRLHQIILSERAKAQRNEEFINTIQQEARIFMKGDK